MAPLTWGNLVLSGAYSFTVMFSDTLLGVQELLGVCMGSPAPSQTHAAIGSRYCKGFGVELSSTWERFNMSKMYSSNNTTLEF